ncbi:MAG: DUF2231 domain-containing protein [Bacteroidota bacterium]
MPNPHPVLVHFPIALLTLAVLFELAAKLAKSEVLSRVGWWNQLTGTLGLAAAVLSGLAAERSVTIGGAARPYVDTHEQLAFIASAVFAVLLLWRIANRSRIPDRSALVYLLLLAVGAFFLWGTAWFGGEIVYRFGVGITTVTQEAQPVRLPL